MVSHAHDMACNQTLRLTTARPLKNCGRQQSLRMFKSAGQTDQETELEADSGETGRPAREVHHSRSQRYSARRSAKALLRQPHHQALSTLTATAEDKG